ncbi:MAG TPA: endonuclease Q family protein [Elusimicrobiota bacterium]|nr:endonuclease Q family protein [Elusimicrobiota bacterium]
MTKFVADLHIHSPYSRACSKDLRPESLYRWCQLKGVAVLGSGDFTHPAWFAELRDKLRPAEEGLFELKPELAEKVNGEIPPTCRAPVRFLLEVEISCIYKKAGRVRKVHHLIYAPSFEVAGRLRESLEKIGNLRSDGRPILGLDSKDLLKRVRDVSDRAYLIPAHAWTPHFAVFGSESGFDSLEECFDELAPEIFALETGLSSDPPMNRRVSGLDRLSLISNSDAHSPEKIAREANFFDAPFSYEGIFDALRRRPGGRLTATFEFFPEEGKYHLDGHRKCQTRLTPKETQEKGGLCPVCAKPVIVGVLSRVEKLADREAGKKPSSASAYESLVPLKELLSETLDVGPGSRKVDAAYHRLLSLFGNELFVLRELPPGRLEAEGFSLLALVLTRMREGKADIRPGYDGEYGVVSFLRPEDRFSGTEAAPVS